jgi:hypothetical protein
MVPISRAKKVAGVIGAVALGYTLSWIATPGLDTGPVESFGPTFGSSVAPVVVAPADAGADRVKDESNSMPKALQANRTEPI